jgi:DNA polymerase III subunit epsilon
MYLFFDTETTGKPKNYRATFKEVDNWPRITQFAWQLYNDEGRLFKSFSSLVKPDGWEVPKEQFFIDNNMSTERCEKEGKLIRQVLELFAAELEGCKFLLAHNMDFDLPITQAEMFRIGMRCENRPEKICTMKSTTDLLQLPGPYGFKWPTLQELHNHLFKCDFEGAHDALDDVTATAKCFFQIQREKLLTTTEKGGKI